MKEDLYRSRLEKPIDEKVLAFISSLEEDLWIAQEDIIGTEAHNIMLYEQGIYSKEEIKKVLASLENIKQLIINNKLDLNKQFEDIHPLIEKLVIDEIGLEIGGKIHTGRSRNDQVSVDIRMKIRCLLNTASNKLFELLKVLFSLSKENADHYIPLYTHLQRGQLGVFSHYINNYISQILRSIQRIDQLYSRINVCPLGACAIGGTNIDIDRKRTAELLGFNDIIINSLDAISSRDYISETLTCLGITALDFSRMAEDLLIWSTKEFNFIEIDDKFCSVSSVMPQKRNPDTLELIRSKVSIIISNMNRSSLMIKGIPSGYFRDFQELKSPLRESFDLFLSIADLFIGIFESIKINKESMEEAVRESFVLALDLAESLVQDFKIPFRQAHAIVAELVKKYKTPEEVFHREHLAETLKNHTDKDIPIPSEFVDSFKDLKTCLDKRISQGSPSHSQITSTLHILKKREGELKSLYSTRLEALEEARSKREHLIKKFLSSP